MLCHNGCVRRRLGLTALSHVHLALASGRYTRTAHDADAERRVLGRSARKMVIVRPVGGDVIRCWCRLYDGRRRCAVMKNGSAHGDAWC